MKKSNNTQDFDLNSEFALYERAEMKHTFLKHLQFVGFILVLVGCLLGLGYVLQVVPNLGTKIMHSEDFE